MSERKLKWQDPKQFMNVISVAISPESGTENVPTAVHGIHLKKYNSLQR